MTKHISNIEARRMVREMAEDLAETHGIMTDEPERVALIREIVKSIPEVDRNLLYLYAALHSYRKAARVLGLSHTVLRREILRIRVEVIDKYNRIK